MGTLRVPRLTEQDYLAAERAADHKSEFVGGEMFAMSGGSARHAFRSLTARRWRGFCFQADLLPFSQLHEENPPWLRTSLANSWSTS